MRLLEATTLWLFVGLLACRHDISQPSDGELKGLVGPYAAVTVNDTGMPRELYTSDSLTIELRYALINIYTSHEYWLWVYKVESRSGVVTGIAAPGTGAFTLSGGAMTFTAISGEAPISATVLPPNKLRVVQRLRPAGNPDTLIYQFQRPY